MQYPEVVRVTVLIPTHSIIGLEARKDTHCNFRKKSDTDDSHDPACRDVVDAIYG